jgi:CDP-paratose 2-epimerase
MRILITGGAGFIGIHTAYHFARHDIHIVDNLSRRGAKSNLQWLKDQTKFSFSPTDIRDAAAFEDEVKAFRPDAVIHLAAQVAVTTSVHDPRTDFEINALGTFNVLEALRKHAPGAIVLYASTNKVYGGMEEVGVELAGERYRYSDLTHGVPETFPLDFHSPYGCSKGAADQYVRDYSRIYGLRSVVFRQSCIYGTHQYGIEDQGWIAWFAIASALGRPITVFGDGKQVRDVLWVEDLVAGYALAIDQIDQVSGQVFNMGGGPERQLSLLETFAELSKLSGKEVEFSLADWRPGDQKVFVADTRKAQQILGWRAQVETSEGLQKLFTWVSENKARFTET